MFEPGSQIGRYEIQRRLGRGGMASVYAAHDPILGRMVAIKVVTANLDLPDERERFAREARAMAALNHPNVVTVHDFGEFESQPFIVMEYVPGETLAGLIRRQVTVPLGEKLRWIGELCAGVGYAHQMQLVHRDIKPANLIIDRSGRLKVLDFGIAHALKSAPHTSMVSGTPGYMAPEQILGRSLDHRTDQFAIGAVCYELLAGVEAFPGDTLQVVIDRILHGEAIPPEHFVPDVDPDLAAIVARTMRKAPDERFPDVSALGAAIARVRERFPSSPSWSPRILDMRGASQDGAPSDRGDLRQTPGSAASAKPTPSDRKRTDREALARRRAIHVETALQRARALLARQQLHAALDACQEALTYDETNAEALELEAVIATALQTESAATHVGEQPFAIAQTMVTPPTIVAGLGTAAPPKVAGSVSVSTREEVAPVAAQRSVAADLLTKPVAKWGLAAGLVVAAVATVLLTRASPGPVGSVIVNAAPWGTIKAIVSEDGEAQPLSPDTSTPVSLTLPAGRYKVTLAGPPPRGGSQEIDIQVEAETTKVAPVVQFRTLSAEDYFEQYLASPGSEDMAMSDGMSQAPTTGVEN